MTEALYALTYAYTLTAEPKWLDWLNKASLPLPLPLPLTPSSSPAFCPSFTNVPCARYLSYHMCCTRTQVHRYSYKHFADPSGGGEWFGYLNRGECTAPGPLYGYCTVSSCYKDVQLPGVDNSQLRT
jgi:hypothetical protein